MPIWQSGELERNTPRTYTSENDNTATTGDNQVSYVADLVIDPGTGQADFSNNNPILPYPEDNSQLRESMQQLLDIILGFFEVEAQKVESGQLEEEMILNDVQENDTNTKRPTRTLPPGFKRRRA